MHLLERPEFADFWALKWSDLLHNEEKALDRKGVHGCSTTGFAAAGRRRQEAAQRIRP